MRIRYTFKVDFFDANSDLELPAPDFQQRLKLSEFDLSDFLDAEIADEGVVGGEIHLDRCDGQPVLIVDYWHPGIPSNQLVDSLREYTRAQFDDGMGEGGFNIEIDGLQLLAVADTADSVIVELKDDQRVVLGPPRIAIAARKGDLPRLATEIKAKPIEIDRLLQGYTALHLAILYGHPEAVRQLLNAGANPKLVDHQGMTSFQLCALSNTLDDEQSCHVCQMLMNAGGNPRPDNQEGESAKEYAELRGKKMLAAML